MHKDIVDKKSQFKYLYGPVYSWRLGYSLGIDPLGADEKICNLDCIYCQLGKTSSLEHKRGIFIPTKELLEEVKKLKANVRIDHLTFSGRGEPTLAKNIGAMIKGVKALRKEKVAVITNSTLLSRKDVRRDLLAADTVLAKLDACCEDTFRIVDCALNEAGFHVMIEGIKNFRKMFKGKLALQVMFVDQNKNFARFIAQIARHVSPDEVQLDTPLRPSAAKPLTKEELWKLKDYFKGIPTITVYDQPVTIMEPFDKIATIKRHGNYEKTLTSPIKQGVRV